MILPDGFTPVAIAAGRSQSYVLGSDGTVYAAGWNMDGELGDGTTTYHYTPESVTNNVASPAKNRARYGRT